MRIKTPWSDIDTRDTTWEDIRNRKERFLEKWGAVIWATLLTMFCCQTAGAFSIELTKNVGFWSIILISLILFAQAVLMSIEEKLVHRKQAKFYNLLCETKSYASIKAFRQDGIECLVISFHVALVIILLNLVETNGEFVIFKVIWLFYVFRASVRFIWITRVWSDLLK